MLRRLLFLNDLHVGSTVAPWPETFTVEGGAPLGCNKAQQFLFQCWRAMVAEVLQTTKPDAVIINGDPIQGTFCKDGQLMTGNLNIQQDACEELLEPLCRGREVRVVRGTEHHDGKSGESIEQIAKYLNAVPDPDTSMYTSWELYYAFDHKATTPVLNIAHHIGVTGNPQSEANVPLRDLLNLIMELTRVYNNNKPNVRCIVRAHRHRYIYVNTDPDLHAVVFPGWQLHTAFVRRKGIVTFPQIGYGYIEWDGTDLLIRPRRFQLPPLNVEVLRGANPGTD